MLVKPLMHICPCRQAVQLGGWEAWPYAMHTLTLFLNNLETERVGHFKNSWGKIQRESKKLGKIVGFSCWGKFVFSIFLAVSNAITLPDFSLFCDQGLRGPIWEFRCVSVLSTGCGEKITVCVKTLCLFSTARASMQKIAKKMETVHAERVVCSSVAYWAPSLQLCGIIMAFLPLFANCAFYRWWEGKNRQRLDGV